MRASCTSRPTTRRLAALGLSVLGALAIAACGGSGHRSASARASTPGVLLSKSLRATGAIESGHIDLALALTLNGDAALGGTPLSLDVAGPFQRDSAGHLATDLTITLTAASKTRTFGLDIVDGKLYAGVGGTFYELPANVLHMPEGATGASGATGLFASLGIHPRTWLTDPHDAGSATVGGVDTDHFTAGVDAQKLFSDLSGLVTQRLSGATGASGASGSASRIASELQLVASAITSAQLDVYTGIADHMVRRVHVVVDFKVPSVASSFVGGITGGSLDFDATLTQLNAPQTITAPANAQPFSAIRRVLRRLGLGLGASRIARLPLSTLG
jgi:hypothetical protein